MKALPILCTGSVVRNIIAGRQTQDRRPAWTHIHDEVVSEKEMSALEKRGWQAIDGADDSVTIARPSPWQKIAVGDLLWVREAFTTGFELDDDDKPVSEQMLVYAATYPFGRWLDPDTDKWRDQPKWTPSIHMPRWASRITLEVVEVRRQRLWDMTDEDAYAEGVVKVRESCHVIKGHGYDLSGLCHTSAVTPFAILWNELYGHKPGLSWADNPEIVALTFRAHMVNIDKMGA